MKRIKLICRFCSTHKLKNKPGIFCNWLSDKKKSVSSYYHIIQKFLIVCPLHHSSLQLVLQNSSSGRLKAGWSLDFLIISSSCFLRSTRATQHLQNNMVLKMYLCNLVCTTRFWNNLYKERYKSKYWEVKIILKSSNANIIKVSKQHSQNRLRQYIPEGIYLSFNQ